jgi:hypothetical protein
MAATSFTVTASSTKSAPAGRRTRWYQFSLMTLTIFIVSCSVLLGVFNWRLHRARKQADAVATIRELQGTVLYDFEIWAIQQQKPGPPQSAWPTYLVHALGQDFFHDVYAVNSAGQPGDFSSSGGQKTPANQDMVRFWSCVIQFPHLRQLLLSGGWMDHDALARLRSPREMENMSIANFSVTDDDLKVVGSMTNLRTLEITGSNYPIATCPITDAGIAALDNLTELEALILTKSQITDDAAPHLAKHRKLAFLQLPGNRLTDKSTPWLGQLTEMFHLSIMEAEIGDAGFGNLPNLTKIEHLSADGTKITDEGLVHLAHLTSLKSLSVRRTKVTPEGVAKFKTLVPACQVTQ